MKRLGPASRPFSTTNAGLAFSLYAAGVPFAVNWKPCRNIYTVDALFDLGGGKKDEEGNVIRPSRYNGLSHEEAIKAAMDENLKGQVEYLFQHTKNLSRLLAAYKAQEQEIKEKDFNGAKRFAELITSIGDETMNEDEGLMRVACLTLKTRIVFMNMWKTVTPEARIMNQGEVTSRKVGDSTVVSRPGCRDVSVNLSEKKRQHLNA